jgi:hypothetical protein
MSVTDELHSTVDPLSMDGASRASGPWAIELGEILLNGLTRDLFFDVLHRSPEGRAAGPDEIPNDIMFGENAQGIP